MDKLGNINEIASTPLWPGLAQKLPGKGERLYLSATTVMDMLNIAFGHSWSVEFSQPWVEPFSGSTPVVTIKATLKVRTVDPETKEPITIVREGIGSESLKGGPNGPENLTKVASTDALKRAAYTFGIVAELARSKNPVAVQYFDYLNSEWKPEIQTVYQKELAEINELSQKYGISDVMLNALVYMATDGQDKKLHPSNIKAVLAFIKEKLNVVKDNTEDTNTVQQESPQIEEQKTPDVQEIPATEETTSQPQSEMFTSMNSFF